MTKYVKNFTIAGIVLTVLLGALFHFVYGWSGNNYIAGLFFATNESVWEHIKLALLPMMLIFFGGSFLLKGANNFPLAAFAAMLTVIVIIPLAFYSYTSAVGRSYLAMDIAIFALSIVLAYCVAYRIFGEKQQKLPNVFAIIGIIIIGVCFFTFTYNAPNLFIFKEPVF